MRNFNYFHPSRIQFGWGRINEIGKIIKRNGIRCLLVTVKPFIAMEELFLKVIKLCQEEGVEIIHYDGAIPEPTDECVNIGSEIAKENNADVILGVGGGSTIDTAKAIAVGTTHEGGVWNYRLGQKRIDSKKVLPIIAVPTTGGTGAEVTNMAVIKSSKDKIKSALADWNLTPSVALVDPELTLTVPPHITASTGFDAFTHSFETFINKNSSDFIDIFALQALKNVIKYLPIAIENGTNKEAREALSFAATLGGLCISNIGTTLPHGIAMALGGHASGISHGEGLAILYPEVNRWTWRHAIKKYAVVGRLFNPVLEKSSDESAAEKCCDEIESFLKKIGLWISLEDKVVSEDDIGAIAGDTLNLRNYTLHPKIANFEDISDLIKKSFRRNK
ncbi:MAG: iron-containing alcohol dehydrogenase [Candidatus Lokiarchaeota archaeon]|nr:iron-containing alcohol dehydrogenase [Candidatus Lokiarchaeota archaeon]